MSLSPMCSFIHIFDKCLLNACHSPGIVQSHELGKCHLCRKLIGMQMILAHNKNVDERWNHTKHYVLVLDVILPRFAS